MHKPKRPEQMFYDQDNPYNENDSCQVCRWHRGEMCPYSYSFIGRHTFDIDNYHNGRTPCHRFVMTQEEQEHRWQLTMDKLQENLVIED